jgi:hypothetical protein
MQNWLASYAKMEGLRRSFQFMARRANYKSNMEFVVDDLIDDYELYEAEFRLFFPDIAAYCQNELDILFPVDRMSKKNQIISEKAAKEIKKEKETKFNKTEKTIKEKNITDEKTSRLRFGKKEKSDENTASKVNTRRSILGKSLGK